MSPILEKAIAVVENELGTVEMILTDPITLRRLQAARIVRAVLVAVRESDETEMTQMGEVYGPAMAATFMVRWRDMIDRILDGGARS